MLLFYNETVETVSRLALTSDLLMDPFPFLSGHAYSMGSAPIGDLSLMGGFLPAAVVDRRPDEGVEEAGGGDGDGEGDGVDAESPLSADGAGNGRPPSLPPPPPPPLPPRPAGVAALPPPFTAMLSSSRAIALEM